MRQYRRWMAAAGLLFAISLPCSAQTGSAPPAGVRAVSDMSKAWCESTPTRERICINGLWRCQPAQPDAAAVPAGDWGYFKVPGSWPGDGADYLKHDSQTVLANPARAQINVRDLQAAWHERDFTVPAGWTGGALRRR